MAPIAPPCIPGRPISQPFPFDPARDLLGIFRAMWAAEKSRPFPGAVKLRKIERLARELAGAIASADVHDPGTAPYERALSRADGVARRVADVVECYDPIEPVVTVAGKRVRGKYRSAAAAWELKWAARVKGG